MGELLYEIDGIKYVLFDIDLNSRSHINFTIKIEKFKGIVQSVKKTNGFWSETIINVKVLIPDVFALQFSNYKSE